MYTFVYVLWRIVSKSYQRVVLNCIPMHMCYDILCNCFVLCMQHIYSCLKMFCVLAVVSVLWIYTFCGTLALVLFCYLSLTIKQRIILLKNNALICRRPYCTEVFFRLLHNLWLFDSVSYFSSWTCGIWACVLSLSSSSLYGSTRNYIKLWKLCLTSITLNFSKNYYYVMYEIILCVWRLFLIWNSMFTQYEDLIWIYRQVVLLGLLLSIDFHRVSR